MEVINNSKELDNAKEYFDRLDEVDQELDDIEYLQRFREDNRYRLEEDQDFIYSGVYVE